MASTSDVKTTTWLQDIFTSIKDLFTRDPSSSENEADAVAGWVGTRKGRGRCRSVGEVH